jgi:hypothetical protein
VMDVWAVNNLIVNKMVLKVDEGGPLVMLAVVLFYIKDSLSLH